MRLDVVLDNGVFTSKRSTTTRNMAFIRTAPVAEVSEISGGSSLGPPMPGKGRRIGKASKAHQTLMRFLTGAKVNINLKSMAH